jgi:hypothetical protein
LHAERVRKRGWIRDGGKLWDFFFIFFLFFFFSPSFLSVAAGRFFFPF